MTPQRSLVLCVSLGLGLAAAACPPTDAIVARVIAIVSGDGQTGIRGAPLELPFVVEVTGSDDNLLRGATVTWAVTGGTGTLTPTTSTTDSVGRARTVLTLGSNTGLVTVSATVAGLAPITFAATAVLPCDYLRPHTLGTSATGTLAVTDCMLADGSYVDYFGFTMSGQAVRIEQTSSIFDTYLLLFDAAGAFLGYNDDQGGGILNSRLRAILPAGGFVFGANSYSPSTFGQYSVTSASVAAGNALCEEWWVVRGVATSQLMEATDCSSSGYYGDVFGIVLLAGQGITATMSNAAFIPHVGLVDGSTGNVVAEHDPGSGTVATITHTAAASAIYLLVATTNVVGATGAYNLSVQVPVGAQATAPAAPAAVDPRALIARARRGPGARGAVDALTRRRPAVPR